MNLLETLKPLFNENTPWKKGVWPAIEKMGLPTKKWDAFRYSSLVQLNQESFKLAQANDIKFSGAAGIIALPLNSAMRSHGALLLKGFKKALKEEKTLMLSLIQPFLTQDFSSIFPLERQSKWNGHFLLLRKGLCTHRKWKSF